MADVAEVTLPNGVVALVRLADSGEEESGLAEKVGVLEALDFGNVSGMLEGVAESIRRGLVKVKPTRTVVELGIDLTVRNGRLTGLLAEAGGTASLRVTLEWAAAHSGGEDDAGAVPAAGGDA